jgi:hypothetical protein
MTGWIDLGAGTKWFKLEGSGKAFKGSTLINVENILCKRVSVIDLNRHCILP